MTLGQERAGLTIVIPAAGGLKAIKPPYWTYLIDALRELIPELEVLEPRTWIRLPWRTRSTKFPGMKYMRLVLPLQLGLIRDLVRSRSSTIVCIEYGLATLTTLITCRVGRARNVFIFQEHRGRGGAVLTRFQTRWRGALGRMATGVVANTEAARHEAIYVLGVAADRVVTVPLLVPPPREAMLQVPIPVRDSKQRPVFLFVGRLLPGKNVDELLAATSVLLSEGLEFETWIVGEGPDRPRLERQRVALKLEGSVVFFGAVEYRSLGFLYEACDAFVMPTLSDYRSMAVLEAMRFGKPVIDSIADGNAGTSVEEGVNGLLFDSSEPGELAACMRRLILDQSLALKLGRRGGESMREATPRRAADALVSTVPGLRCPRGVSRTESTA